ncbi:MAG TPA: dicarboxylate/amino acid:cation symporter [Gammaproteobacteria bacterium]
MRPFQYLDVLQPRSLTNLAGSLTALVAGRLWAKVLVGLGSGLAVGFALGPTAGLIDPSLGALIGNWLALPGMLFLAAVQMIVIPLVFASIILGLASSENVDQLRKLGVVVVAFFVATTAAAVTIGLWVAMLLRPGRSLSTDMIASTASIEPAPALTPPDLAQVPELLIRLLPGNPLGSMVQGEMLQVVIFAIIVGIALVALAPAQSKPLVDLLTSVQQVCMTVVKWAMLLAPLAVFGLMARLTSQIGLDALLGMAFYVLTVIGGLLVLLAMYLVLLWGFARQKPLAFLSATRELLLLSFSTSSSAAVMPLSIKTAEEKLGVRPSIAQFVIPLGATINMNGTALYQGVATVFLAQVYGVDISASGMALIVTMAVGASIGSPATPGVGIVILAMVLNTVGIPPEGVALLMGVDRILDMSRTSINVAGDLVASKLMDRWIGGAQADEPSSKL